MSKTTIEPGWAEIRMTMPRPVPDVSDFKVYGEEAQTKIAKMMLAYVAGFAQKYGKPELERQCIELADELGMFKGG